MRACAELAASPHGDPVRADDLASGQQLPVAFLERILGDLRRGGVVTSVRGRSGGYRLARPADEITLADVIRAVDGPLVTVRDERPTALEYGGSAQALLEVWVALRVSVRDVLDQVTLARPGLRGAAAARPRARRARGRLGQPVVVPPYGRPSHLVIPGYPVDQGGRDYRVFVFPLPRWSRRALVDPARPRRARRPAGRRRPRHGVRRHVDHPAAGHRHQPRGRVGHHPPQRDRHHAGVGLLALAVRERRLEGRPAHRRPRGGRRVPRRLRPVQPRDGHGQAGDVDDPAGARRLHPRSGSRSSGCARTASASRCASGSSRPLGLFAGFVDATGGGGWGPVGTPALLASGRIEPRKVIGSIDTSEFLVAIAASLGFLIALGSQGINPAWVARAPPRRHHRRPDRRVARPQDPGPHPRVGGRRPHRPHQRPHPPPQRLGRPGRHPRRGPHPRRDRARLGRGDRLVGPGLPHRAGPGGRDRSRRRRARGRAGRRSPTGRLTVPPHHDEGTRRAAGPFVVWRQAVGAVACAAARTAAGRADDDPVDRVVVVRGGHEPRLERRRRRVHPGLEQRGEERRVPPRLGGEHGRVVAGAVRGGVGAEERAEQVAGPLDGVRQALRRQRGRELTAQLRGDGVDPGVDRRVREPQRRQAGRGRHRVPRQGARLVDGARRGRAGS